jgi:hypothetical protein
MANSRGLSIVAAAVTALTLLTPVLSAADLPIHGMWKLDERASKNVPDSQKGIDIRITVKGNDVSIQKFYDGASVGEPFTMRCDGVPVTKEIVKGTTGQVKGLWKAAGKILEQTITTKAANLLTMTTTTLFTVSADGQVLTRYQTTAAAGDVTQERLLLYRRKGD